MFAATITPTGFDRETRMFGSTALPNYLHREKKKKKRESVSWELQRSGGRERKGVPLSKNEKEKKELTVW